MQLLVSAKSNDVSSACSTSAVWNLEGRRNSMYSFIKGAFMWHLIEGGKEKKKKKGFKMSNQLITF